MPAVALTLALTVLGAVHVIGVFEMTWGLGAAAVWSRLHAWTIVAHVAVAALTWVLAFLIPYSGSLDERRRAIPSAGRAT